MNKNFKGLALFLVIFFLSLLAYEFVRKKKTEFEIIAYSTFLDIVENKNKLSIHSEKDKPLTIQGNNISGHYNNFATGETKPFKTYIAHHDINLVEFLRKNKIRFFMGAPQEENYFWQTLTYIFPILILLGLLWFFMYRQVQSSGNKAMSFGKSRAKLNADNKKKVTFGDVAGVTEAKEELAEVVDFLKSPQKFQGLGAKIPRGVLLVGPPGTGKTLLARAVAGEAGVPFFSISGSDFVEMFVGVGASRVRDLFSQAKKSAPCIIFIDEIDAVGRLRGAGLGGGHDEREQTLNQLLVEMDGFEENEGIIIIAATNRADVLDPALLRPGRFDRQVVVDAPDLAGRVEILKIHSRKVPLDQEVDLQVIGRGTPGFTGADLANLINEGALLAARNNRKKVEQLDLEEARDKVLMGPERKSFMISPEEKIIIAYHEAGHALLSTLLTHAEPVHKVTIIPRGRALGLTQHLPEKEKLMRSRNYWIDEITVLMGGRLAEELQFKDVTTGASNDIERATAIARKMVTEWGMSNELGPVRYSRGNGESVFVGRDYHRGSDYSDEYARIVDQQVKKIVETCYDNGRKILQKYRKTLTEISNALMEKESINGEELKLIIYGKSGKSNGKKPAVTKVSENKKERSQPRSKGSLLPDIGTVQPA